MMPKTSSLSTTPLDRAIGAFLGMAVADALGSTVEFMSPTLIRARYGSHRDMRGGGALGWEVGQYTDDTQMAVCLARSLIRSYDESGTPGLDVDDLGREFVRWLESRPKDIGNTTRAALSRLQRGTRAALSGIADRDAQANGAVMRGAPIALLWHRPDHRPYLRHDSLMQSYPTHRNSIAAGAAVVVNSVIAHLIQGGDLDAAIDAAIDQANPEWVEFLRIWNAQGRPHRGNSGWAVSTVLTALHCVCTTNSFEDAVIQAVNGGDDADTVGAVTGMIAGARYGADAIPARWLTPLENRGFLTEAARTLFMMTERNTD